MVVEKTRGEEMFGVSLGEGNIYRGNICKGGRVY